MLWRCRGVTFDFDRDVAVMGVLNVTPDSFSDGGRFFEPAAAIEHARRMITAGADLIDVGAESTRPGSKPVGAEEQWRRLEPVLRALEAESKPAAASRAVAVSVDTSNAEVADRALSLGAHVINDVTALGDPAMAECIARAGAGVVLMHLRGTPATMQDDPEYEDVAREVVEALAVKLEAARQAGLAPESIALDPGIGFGKTTRHNLELIARVRELCALGRPVVVGASRKRFIGELSGAPPEQRLEGGLAAHVIAVYEGASVVRTHDVDATVRAVAIARPLREARRRE
ncbi:MAG TPA: dihydropteroate synthase [Candidatus Udaeobacter sp.]|jgi:dihydropteroate synthase|nr:dihydropteroate synthase [Candidatus Udaeobacter sp.]